VESRLEPLGHKVAAIVNYDNFSITPEMLDEYAGMVRSIVERYYLDVTRYTTSTFTRAKLGAAWKGPASPRTCTRARRKHWLA